jgi:hypothetical protein
MKSNADRSFGRCQVNQTFSPFIVDRAGSVKTKIDN